VPQGPSGAVWANGLIKWAGGADIPGVEPRAKPEVTDSVGRAVISYVRRAAGEDAAARMVETAGGNFWKPEKPGESGFVESALTVALVDAAAVICGDPDISRRVGEEAFRRDLARGQTDFLRAMGTPADAIAGGAIAIDARTAAGFRPHRLSCGMTTGYWSMVPTLFGRVGTVVEPECELRGDPRCLLIVSWGGPENEADDISAGTAGAAARTATTMARFENMQATAASLVLATDVDSVLDRIVTHGAATVLAPRFLLAVRLPGEEDLRVHSHGFGADDAAVCAAELVADRGPGSDSVCVVPVTSAHRDYGILAAIQSPGSVVNDVERRLLSAYAGHAASVLETAWALEAARRERDAALGLLELSEALSWGGDPAEVAARLVEAVPRVTGADRAYYWSVGAQGLHLEAGNATPGGAAHPSRLRPPDLGQLLSAPSTLLSGRSGSAAVRVRDRIFGVLVAEFASDTAGRHPEMAAHLRAVAEHGARALDNAELLEKVRHQAHHDPLTDLPNRAMAEEAVGRELARAARDGGTPALLFVDIDRLKAVNDGFGHAVGDALLVEIARRLRECVRDGDQVARLSGDEFLVIAPDCVGAEGAAQVAERILAGLQPPVVTEDQSLFVSASVGIAMYPVHGTDFSALVRNADAAMYRAKFAGRNGWAFEDVAVSAPQRAG
jgi:diguanylate cyclase (GGDEF)-like protein